MQRSDDQVDGLDVGTHEEFLESYATRSTSPSYIARAERLQAVLKAVWARHWPPRTLDVCDIGCGPGTLSLVWARDGHRTHGLDINRKLVDHARAQAAAEALDIQFDVGSATALPWPDASADVCIVPELLEHVREWRTVLAECARVVRRPGLLYLSTTNRRCPAQNEFTLPGFSWYPAPLKRHYIRLAETTRPELANHAKYPAYNWFTAGELRSALHAMGFDRCYDRFDLTAMKNHPMPTSLLLSVLTTVPAARFLAEFFSVRTTLVAIRTD